MIPKITRQILWGVCVAALTVLLAFNGVQAQVGEPFPAFTLQGPDGKVYTNETFRGKVLVIYFLGYN